MSMFWARSRTGRLIEGAAWALDWAIGLGLVSGAVVALVLGKLLLGGILALVALGVFLRFKRRRSTSKRASTEPASPS